MKDPRKERSKLWNWCMFTALKRGKEWEHNKRVEEEKSRKLRHRIFTTQNILMSVLFRAWKWPGLEAKNDKHLVSWLRIRGYMYRCFPSKPSYLRQKWLYIYFLVANVFSVCATWKPYSRYRWRRMDCAVTSRGRNWSVGLSVYRAVMAVGIRCNNRIK